MEGVSADVVGIIASFGLTVDDVLALLQSSRAAWPLVWHMIPHLVKRTFEWTLWDRQEHSLALAQVWNPQQEQRAAPGYIFALPDVVSVVIDPFAATTRRGCEGEDAWLSAYALQRRMCLRTLALLLRWEKKRKSLDEAKEYLSMAMQGRASWYGDCMGESYHAWAQPKQDIDGIGEVIANLLPSFAREVPNFIPTQILSTLFNITLLWNGHNRWWCAKWNQPKEPLVSNREFVGSVSWSAEHSRSRWQVFPKGIRDSEQLWRPDSPEVEYPGPARAIVNLCGERGEVTGILGSHCSGFFVQGREFMVIVVCVEE